VSAVHPRIEDIIRIALRSLRRPAREPRRGGACGRDPLLGYPGLSPFVASRVRPEGLTYRARGRSLYAPPALERSPS